MANIGFFQYIKNYYNKKNQQSYEKSIASFLASLLQNAKERSEIEWFAKLINSDADYIVSTACNDAIVLMQKQFLDLNSKYEDSFKSLKMDMPDIIRILNRVFDKKILDYEDLNGNKLPTRIREYIIAIQRNILEKISGLTFLEIVLREATLVRCKLMRLNTVAEQMKLSLNKPKNKKKMTIAELSKLIPKPGDFYGMNDLLGMEEIKLPFGYVPQVKKYQHYQKMITERSEPQLHEGGDDFELYNQDYAEDVDELSFNEIYDQIKDKEMDRELLDFVKNSRDMQNKSLELQHEITLIPFHISIIEKEKRKIRHLVEDRYDKLNFMRAMVTKMEHHENSAKRANTFEGNSLLEEDFIQRLEEMEHFYRHFKPDLIHLVFGGKSRKVERYALSEYFESSKISKFNQDEVIYPHHFYEIGDNTTQHQSQTTYLDKLKRRDSHLPENPHGDHHAGGNELSKSRSIRKRESSFKKFPTHFESQKPPAQDAKQNQIEEKDDFGNECEDKPSDPIRRIADLPHHHSRNTSNRHEYHYESKKRNLKSKLSPNTSPPISCEISVTPRDRSVGLQRYCI